ncbi:MAG: S41 family peptidase [Verrucomicrobiota bacterium]
MTQFGFNLLGVILLATPFARAAETNAAPDFKEVYDLVRQHLTGMADTDLNRAAVEGLFTNLRGKVTLVAGEGTAARTNVALVSKSATLENDVAYVRVDRVEAGLAHEFGGAVQQLSATNKLKGVVLDLRFAGGDDYAAAAAVANLFLADAKPLLDWGSGVVKSEKKDDIIKLPAAVLVNRETGGAAEALAAVLRETGAGLILGGTTAGRAMTSQEFALQSGQRLRIATSPVKLGNGTALSPQGIKPDIEVAVTLDQERAYFEDAYARLAKNNLPVVAGSLATNQFDGTNRPARRPRPTEADLVRARREGTSLDADSTFARDAEPEKPLIRDPALARAVDLLKGLAVVRQSRP